MKVNLKNLATTGFAAFIATAFTPMAVQASDHNSTNNDATADTEMPADSDTEMNSESPNPDVSDTNRESEQQPSTSEQSDGLAGMDSEELAEKRKEAEETLEGAAEVVQNMKSQESEKDVTSELHEAKAVFLVPNFTRAALGIGGAGAEGVLIVRQDNTLGTQSGSAETGTKVASAGDSTQAAGGTNSEEWSNPVFYNMGAVNAGLEAGVEVGQVAMLLMTDEAVEQFKQDSNFSLNADAGVSIVDYSNRAQASAGKGDVVLWSDTAGAFAGLAVSVDGIVFDEEENVAYYGQQVQPEDIINGEVESQRKNPLEQAMP